MEQSPSSEANIHSVI